MPTAPTDKNVSSDSVYRIGALLFFQDAAGRVLLLRRRRPPNLGLWCAVGGKLEMATGESPYECAIREAAEEVGQGLTAADLELRCILSEKDYEATGHWLMFVFRVAKLLEVSPEEIEEGEFRLFETSELNDVAMPDLDRRILLERVLGGEASEVSFLRTDSGFEGLLEEGSSGRKR